MTSHNRPWKEAKKKEITELAKEYPVIAVATLDALPANIVSIVRKRLKGDARVIVAKTRVVQRAFEETGIDTSKIDPIVKESIAIIFSKKNPFELFSFIKKNKGDATAKTGDIATADLIVQAGDTGLPPGPALSSLKAVGLKVAVQGPTISVTQDKIVTKKGEEVTAEVADVLNKLNMKPMKIGMKVLGVLEKEGNEFYSAEALDVDEEELFDKFVMAYQNALNLSVNAGYYNDDSTEIILIKAEREARAVENEVGSATPSETKEEKKEEKKEESTEEKAKKVEVKEEKVEEVKEKVEEVKEKVDTSTDQSEEETPKEEIEEISEQVAENAKEDKVAQEAIEEQNEKKEDKKE